MSRNDQKLYISDEPVKTSPIFLHIRFGNNPCLVNTWVWLLYITPNLIRSVLNDGIIIVMTLLESLVAVIVGIISIVASAGFGVKWLTKHYFEEIKHELKPNSGTSIKDQVTRMESDIHNLKKQNIDGEVFHLRMDGKLDHLTEVFIEYASKK